MKSKQVNFYLTPNDQKLLMSKINEVVSYVVASEITRNRNIKFLNDTNITRMGEERLRICLTRPEDVDKIVLKHIEKQGYSIIDDIRSPVIQFSRCYYKDGLLRRGRFYFISGYYNDDREFYLKEDSFIKWADMILKLTRKVLTKDGNSIEYYGKEALKLKEESRVTFSSI